MVNSLQCTAALATKDPFLKKKRKKKEKNPQTIVLINKAM